MNKEVVGSYLGTVMAETGSIGDMLIAVEEFSAVPGTKMQTVHT